MKSSILPIEILSEKVCVDPNTINHPNYKEVKVVGNVVFDKKGVSNMGVIGTSDTGKPELYGWRNPVEPHKDAYDDAPDSYVYLSIISGSVDAICCIDNCGVVQKVFPKAGDIIRLNETNTHWTEGEGDCIAIFVGKFSAPYDDDAILKLQRGIRKLSFEHVYYAPRISRGFRVHRVGESYAFGHSDVDYRLMSEKSIARFSLNVMVCATCGEPASFIDKQWPYDNNHVCFKHSSSKNK